MSSPRSARLMRALSRTSQALFVGMLLSACGATTQKVNAEIEADLPANLRADYDSFMVHCSKCHGVERALNAHVTENKHWDLYVAKMMRTAGSAINRVESPKILRFLYWYTDRKKDEKREDNARTLPALKPEDVNKSVSSGSDAVPATTPAAPVPATTPEAVESEGPAQGTQGESAP